MYYQEVLQAKVFPPAVMQTTFRFVAGLHMLPYGPAGLDSRLYMDQYVGTFVESQRSIPVCD